MSAIEDFLFMVPTSSPFQKKTSKSGLDILIFYLKALEVVPAELCKLLLFLLRGALHPCDAE